MSSRYVRTHCVHCGDKTALCQWEGKYLRCVFAGHFIREKYPSKPKVGKQMKLF